LPGSSRRYLERTFLGQASDIRGLFFENFSVFPASMQARALRDPQPLYEHDPYAAATAYYDAAPGGNLERMSYSDLQTYLVELLMKQDQMSMAASVESRVPFLDHRLVEFAASLPARYKLHGWTTKAVLREAIADVVPAPILKRKKMGFPTPVAAWFRGEYSPLVEEFVTSDRALARSPMEPDFVRQMVAAHRTRESNHGDRLWLLLNLEIWQRIFLDGEMPETVMKPLAPRREPRARVLKFTRPVSSC